MLPVLRLPGGGLSAAAAEAAAAAATTTASSATECKRGRASAPLFQIFEVSIQLKFISGRDAQKRRRCTAAAAGGAAAAPSQPPAAAAEAAAPEAAAAAVGVRLPLPAEKLVARLTDKTEKPSAGHKVGG